MLFFLQLYDTEKETVSWFQCVADFGEEKAIFSLLKVIFLASESFSKHAQMRVAKALSASEMNVFCSIEIACFGKV